MDFSPRIPPIMFWTLTSPITVCECSDFYRIDEYAQGSDETTRTNCFSCSCFAGMTSCSVSFKVCAGYKTKTVCMRLN